MDLTCLVDSQPHRTTVRVFGELDAATAPHLRQCLLGVGSDGPLELLVDLSGTSFVDSTGLGVLVGALKRQRVRGGTLTLTGPTDAVRRVLRLTGLDQVFGVADGTADGADGGTPVPA